MTGLRQFGAIIAINALLAFAVHAAAPAQPDNTDRQEYEYVGAHGLDASCPWSVYCYRILVPVMLAQLPVDAELRWRWLQVAANTTAGSIVAITTAGVANGVAAALLATIVVQTSFGFAFTAYDPYTADPVVFAILATLAWCWVAQRWLAAMALGLIGIFAKETVALISVAAALAAVIDRRAGWRMWVAQAGIVLAALLGFHWVMDSYFGWSISTNPAAQFAQGSWLARWWMNNPGLALKGFFLFVPFGFVWLYAAAGFSAAPKELKHLAVGAALPFLALNYVQNPERALSNLFFIIVPLAAIALTRVPVGLAVTAVVTNGLFTAKVGSSTVWLPSSKWLLLPAAASAVWVFWVLLRSDRAASDTQS